MNKQFLIKCQVFFFYLLGELDPLPSWHRPTSQLWINVEPQLSSTILIPQHWYLVEKLLICTNDQPKINLSTTIQKTKTKKNKKNQPSMKLKCQSWKMVETRLTDGWFLVELWLRSWFWLIIVTKLTISQPNINVDFFSWEIVLCPYRV